MKKVGIVMGSDSDLPIIKKATDMLSSLDIPYEVHIYSAHRTPEQARENGEAILGGRQRQIGDVEMYCRPVSYTSI